jgi:protein phosphatase
VKIELPELSLVVLIGPSGSGKSTFAGRHFASTEVLSSDACRALVGDDENDQRVTRQAFEVLHFIAGKRLALGRLTVVDATNVQPESRKPLVRLAREHHVLPVAVVFNMPERVCRERNRGRPDRRFGPHVIRNQRSQLRRSLRGLQREGFRRVFVMTDPEEAETAEVVRVPLWTDRRNDSGPFDIIGDVHGCSRELVALLEKLGYELADGESTARHPQGRRAVFLGDLVDRGPDSPGVLRLVMGMVADGTALAIPGNHENKLLRALRGRNVQVTHGLAESLQQLGEEPTEFVERVKGFLDGLLSHYLLDEGRLVVAHAGLRQEMQGRASAAVRDFALYGDTTGESDEFGLPVRYPWAEDYRGTAMVVYGHTPVPEPEWLNRTICIDTGCVFGGSLTALRYPEKELVSVPAERSYYEPARPFPGESAPTAEAARGSERLDIEDVLGKRHIDTRLARSVTIREENAAAALEVMSRFAADPRWLVYLPPTMAPVATNRVEGLLEHPGEAFAAYRNDGVASLVCQEKHMGSRAIVVVGKDRGAIARRFGIDSEAGGLSYTRTGRPFFDDAPTDAALLERLREAIDRAGLWTELETDWLILDAELLPWSAKAEELIKEQYAAVGAAGTAALHASLEALDAAEGRGRPVEELRARSRARAEAIGGFVASYRRYSRPVRSVEDLRVAPFQVLAGEGRVHLDRPHTWHMEVGARLSDAGRGVVIPTDHRRVDPSDPASQEAAIDWWEDLAAAGGEGIVVKPEDPISRGRRGVVQPGLKVRAREYLRIIYGPEYTLPENFERLRERSLGRKRSLAVREFALGVEALERFVRGEPLYRIHECVFGILALESEPVDPRL